jgi:hypothetical protein
MKFALPLLFGLLGLAGAWAQDRVSVTFKAFPAEYEVFFGGDRLTYSPRGDGLRTYVLPAGSQRVNLTGPGSVPLSLTLDVKAGMPAVQAKLEPRQGPLTLVAEAATGKLPRSAAFSADGKKLFVALQGEPGVDVYEVPSLKKMKRLIAPEGAQSGFTDVLTLGGELWAVQNDGRIHAFDAATLAFKDSKDLTGGGNAYLTDLGGGKVAAMNWDNGQLVPIDVSTRKPLGSWSTTASVRGFAFGQGNGYASYFDRGQLAVIDPATWKVKATWPAGKAPRPVAVLGGSVFVGDMGSAQVLILDAASGKQIGAVAVPSNPHEMVSSGTLVAVASRGKNNPSDYQLAGPEYGKVTLLGPKGEVVGSVWGRNQPTGLALSADGKFLAFTDFLDSNVELYRITR